ncbi:MAG: OmpP1/FadL family transporter [Nitrospirota bacterium]
MSRLSCLRLFIGFALAPVIVMSVTSVTAYAGAFAIDEQGTAAMGQANAFAAQSDDPSALFYNPAGIGQLQGTQVSLATTLIAPSTTFENAGSGQSTSTNSVLFYPTTFYAVHEISNALHVGLGVFTPFGLSTEWPSDWEGRYVTTFSEINTYYFNPNIEWSPGPRLHLAVGISYVPSSVTFRNKLDLSSIPLPDGESEVTADGDGWGYNLAALATLPGENTIGVSFRSAVKIDYSGDATSEPSAVLGPPQAVRSSLTLPPMLTVGVANHTIEALTLEADLQWVGWSKIQSIDIDFVNPAAPDVTTVYNWQDSYSLRFGAAHSIGPVTLRAGYAYDISPVPPDTIDPSIPDSDKHAFTLGGGYRLGRTTIDMAYMFIRSNDRSVDNTITPVAGPPFSQQGKYSARTHELGIGVTYRF